MKRWIPVAVAVVFATFVLASCEPKPPEESWTYVGTWVNPAYNGHGGGPPGKLVVTANSGTSYDNDTDTTPVSTLSLAKTDDWTSGGDHYFKVIAVGPPTNFLLMRVSNNNNTLEFNVSSTAYPAFIDPAGDMYGIFSRQ